MSADIFRVIELSLAGYYCSQIIYLLDIEGDGAPNPELLRALRGLALGCGSPAGPCGALTGGACLIAYYGGKGEDAAAEHPNLAVALALYAEWFTCAVGGGPDNTSCTGVLRRSGGETARCRDLVLACHRKAHALTEELGLRGCADG